MNSGGDPLRCSGCDVNHDVSGNRSGLVTGIEHPCIASPIGPPTALDPRSLVDMAADHDVWLPTINPRSQVVVRVLPGAGCTQTSTSRRRVIHPDPFGRPIFGRLRQLSVDLFTRHRPIPPGADRETHIIKVDAVAIDMKSLDVQPAKPTGALLAMITRSIKIVVTGRGQHDGLRRKPLEILRDDNDLDLQRHRINNMQMIARQHHYVELSRTTDEPIELRKSIVDIGGTQQPHHITAICAA